MMGYFYIAGTILFTVYGQLILKWRIVRYGELPELWVEKGLFLIKILFDPYICSGFFAAFIASFFWMAAMTKFDLSHAYPIIVGGLAILTSVFAILFFKEPISFFKVTGILFIVTGVYLVGRV